MDPPIIAFALQHFQDRESYILRQTGTAYINGVVNKKQVTISFGLGAYGITVGDTFALAHGTVDEALEILECILHDKVPRISERTERIARTIGMPTYTQ
jgi:hypothetical protein